MKKRAFTLVELIVSISILIIFSVVSFLIVTKWMSKSRDSARISDISTIQMALQSSDMINKTLPTPENYTTVYDTGNALAWQQGEFTQKIVDNIGNLQRFAKDPNGSFYGYSLSNDKKYFQVRAMMENKVSYNQDSVFAANEVIKLNGNYNGFLVTNTGSLYSLWNVPSLFAWNATLITSGNNYINENGKVINNQVSLKFATVSTLYDSNTGNDADTLSGIISTFSGTDDITNTQLAVLTMKTAANGILLADAGSNVCSLSDCIADNAGNCVINTSYKSLVDTDLTGANIITGVNIFGVTGTALTGGYCYSVYNITTTTATYTACPAGTNNLLNYYSYFRGGWNGNDPTVRYKNISVCCKGTATSYLQECWNINATCTPAACAAGYTSVSTQTLNDGTDGGDCYNHPRIAHVINVCVKN